MAQHLVKYDGTDFYVSTKDDTLIVVFRHVAVGHKTVRLPNYSFGTLRNILFTISENLKAPAKGAIAVKKRKRVKTRLKSNDMIRRLNGRAKN